VLAVGIFTLLSRRHWTDRPGGTIFALAMAGVVAAYVVYFRFNSQALQIWYAANLMMPAAFVLGGALAALFAVRHAAGVAALVLLAGLCLVATLRPVWPWQAATGWNTGIVAYFARHPVINIDGLVNDEVVPAIKAGDLAGYLKEHGVRYLMDNDKMFTASLRARGGYADGRLERCIVTQRQLGSSDPSYRGRERYLFVLDQSCLRHPPASLGRCPACPFARPCSVPCRCEDHATGLAVPRPGDCSPFLPRGSGAGRPERRGAWMTRSRPVQAEGQGQKAQHDGETQRAKTDDRNRGDRRPGALAQQQEQHDHGPLRTPDPAGE
jgi:hypothetical protein